MSTMVRRTIGIDLAIRGDHVARVFDDGLPVGKPLRFRLTSASLAGFVARVTADLPAGATITAVMEPTGMSWFPVAHWLCRAGIAVIRVKGQRVKALRRWTCLKAMESTFMTQEVLHAPIPPTLYAGIPG
jgi:hypothetical protein